MRSRVRIATPLMLLALVLVPSARAAPNKPTFALATKVGQPGQTLRYQAEGTGASQLAFVYNWGDGSSQREPATGFRSVDPSTGSVLGATVSHAWSAAGTYSVTVTAVDPGGASAQSDPLSVTITSPAAQNDCATGADAGNSFAGATLIATPASCSGTLDGNGFDSTDVYAFDVPQAFRLLTLTVTPPSLWSCCPPEINLVDPAGTIRGGYSIPTLCADPQVFCNTAATGPVEKAIGFTLDQPGRWKLVLGGDIGTIGNSTFVTGSYSFGMRAGGGGDDCVSGRASVLTAPFDAPNQNVGIRLLDNGQVDCTGSLPFADRDFEDLYVFPVTTGEPVALAIDSTNGSAACAGGLWAEVSVPGVRAVDFPFGCVGSALYQADASGNGGIDLHAQWTARTQTLGHRIRLATGSHHSGDCFTGADAPDSAATATAMPAPTCVGDVSAADRGDWYAFTAAAGDQIDLARVPAALPLELVDPSGTARGGGPLTADQGGTWRIHVATDLGTVPHFEGAYGIRVNRTPTSTPPPTSTSLAGVSVSPTQLTGGAGATGTATLTQAADASTAVSLSSSNPAVVSVPASATVAAGASAASFTVMTASVSATTTVTITASFGGTTRTATLTVDPLQAPGASDTVSVTRAEFASGQLRIDATSTSSSATLRAFTTSTAALIGTLGNDGGGRYSGRFDLATNPQNVTVTSSLGGSAGRAVVAK